MGTVEQLVRTDICNGYQRNICQQPIFTLVLNKLYSNLNAHPIINPILIALYRLDEDENGV